MDCNYNSFHQSVQQCVEESHFLEEANRKMDIAKSITDPLKKVIEQGRVMFDTIEHLHDYTEKRLEMLLWAIKTLDPDEDVDTLDFGLDTLRYFGSFMNEAMGKCRPLQEDTKLQWLATKELEMLEGICNGPFIGVCELTQARDPRATNLSEKNETPPILPMADDMGPAVDPEASDLLLSVGGQRALTSSSYIGLLYNSLPSPLAYTPPLPSLSFIKSFIGRVGGTPYLVEKNAPVSLQGVVSLLKGEQHEVHLVPLAQTDQHGGQVEVPSSFNKDVSRQGFYLNGKDGREVGYTQVSRDLYKMLGREAARRVMYLCHQGVAFHPLFRASELIGDNSWARGLKEERQVILADYSANNGGFFKIFVDVDVDSHIVTIVASKTFKCVPKEDPETILAYFVTKTLITLPIAEIARDDFDANANPVPGLTVEDSYSKLVLGEEEFKALAETF